MRTDLTCAALALAAFAFPQALAACEIQISAPAVVRFSGADAQGYDSFSSALYDSDFTVTVENVGGDRCSGALSLRTIDSQVRLASGASETLSYEVVGPGSGQGIVTPAGAPVDATDEIPLNLNSGQRRDIRLRFRVPQRQIVPAGTYNQTVSLEFNDDSDVLVTEKTLELLTMVRSSMSILVYRNSIGQANSDGRAHRFDMDFETLETGEQQSVKVLVLSNNPYTVQMMSENGGVLAHTVLGAAQTIPYELTFGGRRIPAASSASELAHRPLTAPTGELAILTVQIGEVGLARAGTYQDVLTLTIQPD